MYFDSKEVMKLDAKPSHFEEACAMCGQKKPYKQAFKLFWPLTKIVSSEIKEKCGGI